MVHTPIQAQCDYCDNYFTQTHRAIKHCREKCYIQDNSYINKKTGCWVWKGTLSNSGYGKFTRKGETISAHRASYEAFVGDINAGLHICHHCDNRACVNPTHLFIGTQSDNEKDKHAKGRGYAGRKHHDNKLTIKQVLAIRKDTRIMREIADEYGISTAAVSDIRKRAIWKHLPEEGEEVFERKYGKAQLTITQMKDIINDTRTQAVIATEYGIQQAYVSKLKLGKVYKELLVQ